MRRTRIVCTLGPSSSSPAVIRHLVHAGMDVARINCSHGDHEEQRRLVATVREVSSSLSRHVALLQDLQGPKIRTGRLRDGHARLRRGAQVTVTGRDVQGDDSLIAVSHPSLVRALKRDDRLLLADAEIELRVERCQSAEVTCTVVRGGVLGERKGIAAPGTNLRLPSMTAKDHADLRLGAELGFDYVALSFVRSERDVAACRSAMRALGMAVPLIAKLERPGALQHLDAILRTADAVMVARGDLGVELSLAEVPAAQKDIIERANRVGVPVITATEMLESMVVGNRPTRAEASDVANAIWDGTDAVMLSQETSVGLHPVDAVRAMAMICRAAEEHSAYDRQRPQWAERGTISSSIAHAAAAVAAEVGARAIVAFTETGATALRVSKAHPSVPILAASPHEGALRRTALYSGVVPLTVAEASGSEDMAALAAVAVRAAGHARRGDRLVIVAGVASQPGQTNVLKVITLQ